MFSLSLNLFCNIHLSQLFVTCREDKWLFNQKSLSALTFLYLCMEMGNDHIFLFLEQIKYIYVHD